VSAPIEVVGGVGNVAAMRKQTTQFAMSIKCGKEDGRTISNMVVIYENINTGHVCVCASALNYYHNHISTSVATYLEPLKRLLQWCDGNTPNYENELL